MNNVQDQPPKCANGCGFFGNPATRNLCSKCYHDLLKKIALETQVKLVPRNEKEKQSVTSHDNNNATSTTTTNTMLSSVKKTKTITRCSTCNKRVGLTGFDCRCGGLYCVSHRYPEEHSCGFDHKGLKRKILSKELCDNMCKAPKLDYKI